MDVNDRSLRIDAPAINVIPSDPPAAATGDNSFGITLASSLKQQTSSGNSAASNSAPNSPSIPAKPPISDSPKSSGLTPQSVPANRESNAADTKSSHGTSTDETAAASQAETTAKTTTDQKSVASSPADDQKKAEETSEDPTANVATSPDASTTLAAELLLAQVVPTPSPVDKQVVTPPTNAAPSSLAKALQPAVSNAPVEGIDSKIPAPVNLPAIPTGLQAGLTSPPAKTTAQGTANTTETDVTEVPAAAPAAKTDQAKVPLPAQRVASVAPNSPSNAVISNATPPENPVESTARTTTPNPVNARLAVSNGLTPTLTNQISSASTDKSTNSVSDSTVKDAPPQNAQSGNDSSAALAISNAGFAVTTPSPVVTTPALKDASSVPKTSDAIQPATSMTQTDPLPSLAGVPGGDSPPTNSANSPTIQLGSDLQGITSANTSGNFSQAPPVWQQISPALHQAVFQDQQMTVVLRPPELGTVQIDIQRQDGQITARLQTETATAHQLLSDHLPQLRETLSAMGVSADQIQLVQSDSSPDNSGNLDSRTNGQMGGGSDAQARQDTPQQTSPPAQLAEEPERDDSPATTIRSRTALNLQI